MRDGEPSTEALPAWHALGPGEVLARLDSSRDGLPGEEAALRLRLRGPNLIEEAEPVRPLRILARQFASLLVWLLLAAVAISGLLGEWLDALAILSIVLLNAGIGFYQEWSAERAIASLRRLTSPRARVRRGRFVGSIPAAEVVPGDVVLLETGDLVPADVRLLESRSLRCNEAVLTGESEPVDKQTEVLGRADLPLGDRTNLAFMGASVVGGNGLGVVVGTAMTTELGRIALLVSRAAAVEGETPLQHRLEAFGRFMVWGALGIVLLLFALGVLRGLPLGAMLLTSISLAIAAVPEGLPAVVTVALALGVRRMSRRRALIRKLPAVETLGSADVICSDKTGTLTMGEMTGRALYAGGLSLRITGEGYAPHGEILLGDEPLDEARAAMVREVLRVLVGASNASVGAEGELWKVVGDPTEGALLAAGAKVGIIRESLERELPRVGEWPFDADRRRMSIARRGPGKAVRLCVKGAPESIVSRCTKLLDADGLRELGDEDRRAIVREQGALAERGLRVLACAWRDLDEGEARLEADAVERDLVFAGLFGMQDPPRPEAVRSVALCQSAGIRVVMVTGDHPRTALAIARELGLPLREDQALTSEDLRGVSDAELAALAPRISVFARVTAADKLRIVRAWQSSGAVVAMTGDGVNDAPALQGADIGVAMGLSGTEVAKEASDMVVTDDDFASIVAAVEEGRGVYDNIRKTLQYLLAGNAGELLLMAACIVGGLPVPLLPIHLLWINLVTDGLPALCLATDPIDPDVMRRPPRPRAQALADRSFLSGISLTGVLTAAVSLGAYLYGLRTGDEPTARSFAFTTLVFAELLRAFSGRHETTPVWRVSPLSNLKLAAVVLVTLGLQVSSHHVEVMRVLLKTAPLSWASCAALLAAATIPLAALEARKVRLSRGTRARPAAGPRGPAPAP